MSDPVVSEIVEGGKAVGSGGGLLALGLMVVNIFKKKVEVDDEREAKALEGLLAESKAQTASLGEVKTMLGVLSERVNGVVVSVAKHDEKIDRLEREVAELTGAYKALLEQLAK